MVSFVVHNPIPYRNQTWVPPCDIVRDDHMVRSKWSHGPKIWSHGPDGNNSVGYVQVRKRMVKMWSNLRILVVHTANSRQKPPHTSENGDRGEYPLSCAPLLGTGFVKIGYRVFEIRVQGFSEILGSGLGFWGDGGGKIRWNRGSILV